MIDDDSRRAPLPASAQGVAPSHAHSNPLLQIDDDVLVLTPGVPLCPHAHSKPMLQIDDVLLLTPAVPLCPRLCRVSRRRMHTEARKRVTDAMKKKMGDKAGIILLQVRRWPWEGRRLGVKRVGRRVCEGQGRHYPAAGVAVALGGPQAVVC